MKQLTQHITDIHKLTKDEFLTQYPNTKLWVEEVSERCSKAQNIGIQTYRDNLANDPHYYDDVYAKRYKKRNHEEIANKTRKTRIERGTNEKMSERVKKMWENPEYRQMQVEKTKRQHENGLTDIVVNTHAGNKYYTEINGIVYYFKSSWEVKFAQFLFENTIDFQYEPFYIKYMYDGRECKYYPDFYLKSCNLLIEVKPMELCENDKVIAKKNACIAQGFKFMFVTQNELKDLESLRFDGI